MDRQPPVTNYPLGQAQPDDAKFAWGATVRRLMEGLLAGGWPGTAKFLANRLMIGGTAFKDYLPWHVELNPFINFDTATNWATRTVDAAALFNGRRDSTGAVNATIGWSNLPLAAGTYQITFLHTTGPDRGIYSVQIDSVQVGTIDGYTVALTQNAVGTLTGIAVATTALHTLSFVMSAKNAASTNFTGSIQWIKVRRTA